MGLRLICAVLAGVCCAQFAQAAGLDSIFGRHRAVMAELSSLFHGNPVEIVFADGEIGDGKRIGFHWQFGRFRQEYNWLGFTEVFGYDGVDHWYGSDLSLPYSLNPSAIPDVTAELIRNFQYLQPSQAGFITLPEDVPLDLDERYVVLRYLPPGMSESLLLLDPFDFRLAGFVLGTLRLIEQAPVYRVTTLEEWADYGSCWYPTVIRTTSVSPEGDVLKEKRHTALSVEVAEALLPGMFSPSSSPPVPQPALPSVPYVVPFSYTNQTVLVRCRDPQGRTRKLELDTGAAVGVLRRDTAGEIGLELRGDETVTGHGTTAAVEFGRVEGFVLEGAGRDYSVALPPWPAAVFSDSAIMDESLKSKNADGLLGNFLLSNFVVTLDYRRRQMLLYPPSQFDPAIHLGEGYDVIEVTRDSMPFVQVEVDGQIRGGAFFNTGAQQYFTLAAWACDAAGITYPVEEFAEAVTISGYTAFGIIRPEEVRIGRLVLEKPRTHLEILAPGEAPNPNRIASFGNEFFSRTRVTFDLFSRSYYIEDFRQ